jgi:catechol 2,3-dioxygenase-like lactoylglutathione lyase family enzyme
VRLNQVTVQSTDLAESVRFYSLLGLIQIVASDHYVRFVCPDGDATFSVDAVEEMSVGRGPVVYFECDDLDARVEELSECGLVFRSGPTDQPWMWREARLVDPDGNEICLYHAGENRLNPPWRIATPPVAPQPTRP